MGSWRTPALTTRQIKVKQYFASMANHFSCTRLSVWLLLISTQLLLRFAALHSMPTSSTAPCASVLPYYSNSTSLTAPKSKVTGRRAGTLTSNATFLERGANTPGGGWIEALSNKMIDLSAEIATWRDVLSSHAILKAAVPTSLHVASRLHVLPPRSPMTPRPLISRGLSKEIIKSTRRYRTNCFKPSPLDEDFEAQHIATYKNCSSKELSSMVQMSDLDVIHSVVAEAKKLGLLPLLNETQSALKDFEMLCRKALDGKVLLQQEIRNELVSMYGNHTPAPDLPRQRKPPSPNIGALISRLLGSAQTSRSPPAAVAAPVPPSSRSPSPSSSSSPPLSPYSSEVPTSLLPPSSKSQASVTENPKFAADAATFLSLTGPLTRHRQKRLERIANVRDLEDQITQSKKLQQELQFKHDEYIEHLELDLNLTSKRDIELHLAVEYERGRIHGNLISTMPGKDALYDQVCEVMRRLVVYLKASLLLMESSNSRPKCRDARGGPSCDLNNSLGADATKPEPLAAVSLRYDGMRHYCHQICESMHALARFYQQQYVLERRGDQVPKFETLL